MTKVKPKKLLTAAVGVATVSYVVGCGGAIDDGATSGNLVAPPDTTTGVETSTLSTSSTGNVNPGATISGNLMPPPATTTPPIESSVISGNLMAPPETSEPPVDTGIISGNLLPPPSIDPTVSPPDTSDVPEFDAGPGDANAPPDSGVTDSGAGPSDAVDAGLVISGNLLPPPSPDADLAEEP